MDLVIEARAYVQGNLQDVEIGIDETKGTIEAVKRTLSGEPRKRFRGHLLFPSAVDWHVHFRDPGAAAKEDFKTGTLGAALGGVGTVFDMPNTDPVVDRVTRLEEKIDAIKQKALVDWGLWATVTPETPNAVEIIEKSNGLKLYLSPTTNSEASLSDEQLTNIITQAQDQRRWVAVHAEHILRNTQAPTTWHHDANRPASAEVQAIHRLVTLAQHGHGVHVAHATTTEAVQAALDAGFSAGATPHHLLLSHESHRDAFGKVNPPLRSETQRRSLWKTFTEGRVPLLESDHAPHTITDKKNRFPEAPAGIPGVETMLPMLLFMAKHGDAPLSPIIQAACDRPAEQMSLKRGRIAPGYQADFFLVDPQAPTKIRADQLASRAGWTPYEGRPMLKPHTHYLRGKLVVEEGHFVGTPGKGQRVPPTARPWVPLGAAGRLRKP